VKKWALAAALAAVTVISFVYAGQLTIGLSRAAGESFGSPNVLVVSVCSMRKDLFKAYGREGEEIMPAAEKFFRGSTLIFDNAFNGVTWVSFLSFMDRYFPLLSAHGVLAATPYWEMPYLRVPFQKAYQLALQKAVVDADAVNDSLFEKDYKTYAELVKQQILLPRSAPFFLIAHVKYIHYPLIDRFNPKAQWDFYLSAAEKQRVAEYLSHPELYYAKLPLLLMLTGDVRFALAHPAVRASLGLRGEWNAGEVSEGVELPQSGVLGAGDRAAAGAGDRAAAGVGDRAAAESGDRAAAGSPGAAVSGESWMKVPSIPRVKGLSVKTVRSLAGLLTNEKYLREWQDTPDFAADLAIMKKAYAGNARHLDTILAPMFDLYGNKKLQKTTVVVFTGDHGEIHMERGQLTHAESGFDEGLAIPAAVRFPNEWLPPERVKAQFHIHRLADLVWGILNGEVRHANVSEQVTALEDDVFILRDCRNTLRGLRYKNKYKYLADAGSGVRQLYDLESDPGELVNIAASAPAVADEMEALYWRNLNRFNWVHPYRCAPW